MLQGRDVIDDGSARPAAPRASRRLARIDGNHMARVAQALRSPGRRAPVPHPRDTRSEPGRVDSPPTSRISAPSAASSARGHAPAPTCRGWPPSEKLSGVTFTIPMIRGRPASIAAKAPAWRLDGVKGHLYAETAGHRRCPSRTMHLDQREGNGSKRRRGRSGPAFAAMSCSSIGTVAQGPADGNRSWPSRPGAAVPSLAEPLVPRLAPPAPWRPRKTAWPACASSCAIIVDRGQWLAA